MRPISADSNWMSPLPPWQNCSALPSPARWRVTRQSTSTHPPPMCYLIVLHTLMHRELRLTAYRERQFPQPACIPEDPARVAAALERVDDDRGTVSGDRTRVPNDRKRFTCEPERVLTCRARDLGVRERDLIGSSVPSVRLGALWSGNYRCQFGRQDLVRPEVGIAEHEAENSSLV